VINNAKLNEQEVESGTLSSYTSVDFSQVVNRDFSLLGFNLLSLNFGRGCLGNFKGFNQRNVGQDSIGVGLGQVFQKGRFKTS